MRVTHINKKGGYFLLGKELFIYHCGNCNTSLLLKSKDNQKYCHECGRKFNWSNIKRIYTKCITK